MGRSYVGCGKMPLGIKVKAALVYEMVNLELLAVSVSRHRCKCFVHFRHALSEGTARREAAQQQHPHSLVGAGRYSRRTGPIVQCLHRRSVYAVGQGKRPHQGTPRKGQLHAGEMFY